MSFMLLRTFRNFFVCRNLYEKLQKSVDKTNEGNSANQSIPFKTKGNPFLLDLFQLVLCKVIY